MASEMVWIADGAIRIWNTTLPLLYRFPPLMAGAGSAVTGQRYHAKSWQVSPKGPYHKASLWEWTPLEDPFGTFGVAQVGGMIRKGKGGPTINWNYSEIMGVEIVIVNIGLVRCRGSVLAKQGSLLTYYENNSKRMRYKDYLGIGSGPMESAHRTVIQQCMKLSGQRWTLRGTQQRANLRVVEKSGNWRAVKNLRALLKTHFEKCP